MPALGPPGALSPNDWGAQVDYDEWRDLFSPDDGVAAHHGGGADYPAGRPPFSVEKEAAQLRSWEQSHLAKGWRGLAYGWGIGLSGATFRIRGWARYGAHTGDVDGDGIANNDEIIPFIIIGSGHHHTLTPEAETAIVRLRRFIEEGSPDAIYLYGHQELRGIVTSCPGPNFMTYVRNHRLLEDDMTPDAYRQIIREELVEALGGSRIEIPNVNDEPFQRYGNQGIVNSVWHAHTNGVKLFTILNRIYGYTQQLVGDQQELLDVDEEAIAAAVLAGLSPDRIADALEAQAGDIVDAVRQELNSRLGG